MSLFHCVVCFYNTKKRLLHFPELDFRYHRGSAWDFLQLLSTLPDI